MILTYPIPDNNIIAAFRQKATRGIIAARPVMVVEVDGLQVRPSLGDIKNYLGFVAEVGPCALAVSQDHIEAARAQAEKYRIFTARCLDLGLVNGTERGHDCCSACNEYGDGVMFYSPDASGDPSYVAFTCDNCLAK